MRSSAIHRRTARRPTAASEMREVYVSLPCNIVLHAALAFSGHSPARGGCRGAIVSLHPCLFACPPRRASLHPASFDRYTCRTKIAVSSSTSSKLPNLIDTEFAPAARGSLHLGCSCPIARLETLPISNLQLPPPRACYVVLRGCIHVQNLSARVPRDFPRNCRPDLDRHPERSIAERRISPPFRSPAMLRRVTWLHSRPKSLGTPAERFPA